MSKAKRFFSENLVKFLISQIRHFQKFSEKTVFTFDIAEILKKNSVGYVSSGHPVYIYIYIYIYICVCVCVFPEVSLLLASSICAENCYVGSLEVAAELFFFCFFDYSKRWRREEEKLKKLKIFDENPTIFFEKKSRVLEIKPVPGCFYGSCEQLQF